MRLTDFTDYSLRVLIYLAMRPDTRATIDEITAAYKVSRNHLVKVVHRLGQQGYVETLRGRGGGLRLAPGAMAVTLGEVVRRCEPDFRLVECFEGAGDGCVIAGTCALQHALVAALDAYLEVLDSTTLADLVRRSGPAQVRLFPKKTRKAA
jgi:Rrf2 family nitric oxide-sensitive transcriptional repressor